jgi:hypothetical protein
MVQVGDGQCMPRRCWRGVCRGNRAYQEQFAVWNLTCLIFQLMVGRPLFPSRLANAFAAPTTFRGSWVRPVKRSDIDGWDGRKEVGSSAGRESAKYLGRDNGRVFLVRSKGFEIVDQANTQL